VITGLHHIQLACPPGSEPASRAFYGDLLGMTEVPKPAALAARGGAWFRSGGAELHLGVETDFRPARKAHPGLIVSNLDTLARRLVEAGYAAVADELFPGYRRVYTEDPHGNRLELMQRVDDGVDGEEDRDPEQQAGRDRHQHDAADPDAAGGTPAAVRFGQRLI
jgi:catechol 2,3-dioxygenase-like lactoylglutathione lyase family enzyme